MIRHLARSVLVMAAIALLDPAPASARWSRIGIARFESAGGTCGQVLGPAQGDFYGVGVATWGGDEYPDTLVRYGSFSIDGVVDPARVDWSQRTGAWQVTWEGAVNYGLAITITAYPDPATSPLTEHRGLVLVDHESSNGGADGWFHTNVAQEIPTPVVRAGVGRNDIAWAPPPSVSGGGPCEAGGEEPVEYIYLWWGWNVYRLLRRDVPPATSTPEHYLCGPDLDCRTVADNGFVAFVPHVVAPDGLLHYTDTAVPSDPILSDFVYVVQPVKRGTPTGDSDGDTIPDEDLNGDRIPEFVDPSGLGRGLTGRVGVGVGFSKPILLSPDSITARDVLIYVRKITGGYSLDWDPLGPGASPIGHDAHAGDFSDFRDPVLFAERDRLACDLPDGPGSIGLVDPGFARGHRYYLMSVAYAAGSGFSDEYGSDSFGVPHPPTTTPPPCR